MIHSFISEFKVRTFLLSSELYFQQVVCSQRCLHNLDTPTDDVTVKNLFFFFGSRWYQIFRFRNNFFPWCERVEHGALQVGKPYMSGPWMMPPSASKTTKYSDFLEWHSLIERMQIQIWTWTSLNQFPWWYLCRPHLRQIFLHALLVCFNCAHVTLIQSLTWEEQEGWELKWAGSRKRERPRMNPGGRAHWEPKRDSQWACEVMPQS